MSCKRSDTVAPATLGAMDGRTTPPGSAAAVALADILDALPTREIAKGLAYLSPSGPGKLVGRCPLHRERTPSFAVSNLHRPGRFHRIRCRGCGFRGDVIDLMATVEGIPRATLLAELPVRLGLIPPTPALRPKPDPDLDEF